MYAMRAKWVRFFRNAGTPIARLRQHVVPPNHANYSQLGFKAHPPNPLQREAFFLCASFRSSIEATTFHSKPQLRWIGGSLIRVVGLWGLCWPFDEKPGFPTNNSPLAACEDRSKCQHLPWILVGYIFLL